MFVNKNQFRVSELAELRCFGEGKIRGSPEAGKRGLITCQRLATPPIASESREVACFKTLLAVAGVVWSPILWMNGTVIAAMAFPRSSSTGQETLTMPLTS